jgi:hypothetical protein
MQISNLDMDCVYVAQMLLIDALRKVTFPFSVPASSPIFDAPRQSSSWRWRLCSLLFIPQSAASVHLARVSSAFHWHREHIGHAFRPHY